MTKTPNASRKLDHARIHLGLLQEENRKDVGKDRLAMEAHMSACLGAVASAYERLHNEVDKDVFKRKNAEWRSRLTPEDQAFFDRMKTYRDIDVHRGAFKTTEKAKPVPAHMVPGVQVFGPVDALIPNPDPGGTPRFAPAWIIGQEVYVKEEEATQACGKYLELMENLVRQFQNTKEE